MKPRNVSTLALLIGSFLVSAGLEAAPCPASDSVLCLSAQRFSVDVRWRDFAGNTGTGRAVRLTPDTGYFWFFSDSNVELVVKVLDARGFNGHFWVFFGALSNVEYTLTVTDTETGATKSYQNPSGQFASVGDTAAFRVAAAGGIATHETVQVQGSKTPPESLEAIQRFIEAAGSSSASEAATAKAASSTPCPGPSTSLFLSNCRFELRVEWTDFQGRTGSGQAVHLTSDTGYFWFFSESNVELIVKVLDARGFNDRFWVFYGALSNVEYSLHVTDRVSGALRIYRNPSGDFASVGDTSAFRGGYSVAVTADAGRAVSGEMSKESGGTLSATAADGTVFTLEVPPNALFSKRTITMTPVSAIDRLPFSAGLVAGVNLEPSGFYLLEGARLTIRTPTPISQSEETAFAWNGSGEELFLYPPLPAGGDLKLSVVHLGGYGVARGTDAERQAQAPREPAGEDDRLSHRIALFLREGRAEALGATSAHALSPATIWRPPTQDEYQTQYRKIWIEMLVARDPDEVVDLVTQIIAWAIGVSTDLADGGPIDTVFPGRHEEIRSLVERMVLRALDTIHQRCSWDVTTINKLPQILAISKKFDLRLGNAVQNALKCLTFKLTFESTTTATTPSPAQVELVHSVKAEMTLKPSEDPFFGGDVVISGEGRISVESVQFAQAGGTCTLTSVDNSGSDAFYATFFFPYDLKKDHSTRLNLGYDPGKPPSKVTTTCTIPNAPPIIDHSDDLWRVTFDVLHARELRNGQYYAGDWIVTGRRNPYATKSWVLLEIFPLGVVFRDTTNMRLVHTPE